MALSGHALLTRNPAHNQLQPHNKRDIHGVVRTACANCTECPQVLIGLQWCRFYTHCLQFISIPGHVLCAYCGCPPARHGKGIHQPGIWTQPKLQKWIQEMLWLMTPLCWLVLCPIRDCITARGTETRETQGLIPGCSLNFNLKLLNFSYPIWSTIDDQSNFSQ